MKAHNLTPTIFLSLCLPSTQNQQRQPKKGQFRSNRMIQSSGSVVSSYGALLILFNIPPVNPHDNLVTVTS